MKKAFCFFVISAVVFGLTALPAEAQQEGEGGPFNRSEFYVVHLPIEKVWVHNKGYIVEYRKTPLVSKKVFLPIEWFLPSKEVGAARKGEIILTGTGKSWPHMSVYYKGGAIDHIRLFVRRNERHFTWGALQMSADYDFDESAVVIEYK
ncbi:MAG: hypothetical protein LBC77_06780 [Spirochaetaceae bacterium]|jgi:hypothetical protein|nr:hypothetical protein [Spirochaetaceae bacterium]